MALIHTIMDSAVLLGKSLFHIIMNFAVFLTMSFLHEIMSLLQNITNLAVSLIMFLLPAIMGLADLTTMMYVTVSLNALFGCSLSLSNVVASGLTIGYIYDRLDLIHNALTFARYFWLMLACIIIGNVIWKVILAKFGHRQAVSKNYRALSGKDCQEVIAARNLKVSGLGENARTPYVARWIRNTRLVEAFGIRNSFTVPDRRSSEKFRDTAASLMLLETTAWEDIVSPPQISACQALESAAHKISLTVLVQRVAMKCVINPLFGIDALKLNQDNNIDLLAAEINQQWLQSKGFYDGLSTPPWTFGRQYALRNALKALDLYWDEDDADTNPLNLILPGYETLWRVVIHCFLELITRGHKNAGNWKQALKAFAKPTFEQLEEIQQGGINARMVVEEALRLYPPTRRINRLHGNPHTGKMVRAAADVEYVHRDPLVWGRDALEFRPERWIDKQGLDEFNKAKIFMPFGSMPFVCPAKAVRVEDGVKYLPFGVSMIAIVVAALVEAVGDAWVVEGEIPKIPRPMASDREAHQHLQLRARR